MELFTFSRRVMARYLSVSPSTIWYRLRKLQKQGELVGYYSRGRASVYEKNEKQVKKSVIFNTLFTDQFH
jgi:DNA-binding Lrp family transcriptional regulator